MGGSEGEYRDRGMNGFDSQQPDMGRARCGLPREPRRTRARAGRHPASRGRLPWELRRAERPGSAPPAMANTAANRCGRAIDHCEGTAYDEVEYPASAEILGELAALEDVAAPRDAPLMGKDRHALADVGAACGVTASGDAPLSGKCDLEAVVE